MKIEKRKSKKKIRFFQIAKRVTNAKARGIKRKPKKKLTHIILREPVTENVTIRSRTDQAIKSIRRMPWHQETTKDVTSCEKLRGGANIP